MDLTDEQWAAIQPLIPDPPKRHDGKGRPWRDSREIMDGILWILRTGAAWQDMPKDRYPPFQTCHRRFQQWVRSGIFENILQALATDLRERGQIDLSECFIDSTFFAGAKKVAGRVVLERPSGRSKVQGRRSSWQWQTVLVFLSPYTLRLLHHMRSPLLKQLSPSVLSLLKNSHFRVETRRRHTTMIR